jgi:hypothetical protein
MRTDERPKIPMRSRLSVGLPFLGVLIFLIIGAISWIDVASGQGYPLRAVAFTAALAACIWLARRNRRATIVMSLRVLLLLGVLGVIGHPSITVVTFLGVVALVYFLVECFWPTLPGPPAHDIEAVSGEEPN